MILGQELQATGAEAVAAAVSHVRDHRVAVRDDGDHHRGAEVEETPAEERRHALVRLAERVLQSILGLVASLCWPAQLREGFDDHVRGGPARELARAV
jgi:hypothetical protein